MFLRFRLGQWYRNRFLVRWDKFIHFRKCSCGHPFWYHQCYEHGTCIHGSCLAETFADEICVCEGFNNMWNEDYPPNKPELRLQKQDGVM